MAYEYIKRMYPVTPNVGARVRHHVTKQEGTIRRENPSAGHYVQVLFDGEALGRHRSYSLAVTKIEEAVHWMRDRKGKPA